MKAVSIEKLKCLRCGHEWIPRTEIIMVCPKCKSYFWDKPSNRIGGKNP